MRRKLFPFASALSLLACLTVTVDWVRSHLGVDHFSYISDENRYILRTGGGHFALWITKDDLFRYVPQGWQQRERFPGRREVDGHLMWNRSIRAQSPTRSTLLGFWCGGIPGWSPPGGPATTAISWGMIGPIWPLIVSSIALPTLYLTGHRRRRGHRRQSLGLCHDCGYNLTGNTSGTCPECGTTIAVKADALA